MKEYKPSRKNTTLENIKENKNFEYNVSSFKRRSSFSNTNSSRTDKFGNVISKNNSHKYKICFADQIDKDKNLVEVHLVESYKQYNSIEDKKCIILPFSF